MKKLLNTLYVLSDGAYLNKEGETLTVKLEGAEQLRVPIHTLESVIILARVTCTPQLLALCAEHQVYVSFHTQQGRFLARVQGPVHGNVLLRRAQYRAADNDSQRARLAYAMVVGKLANCRQVVLRAAREAADQTAAAQLGRTAQKLGRFLSELDESMSLEALRAREGAAAQAYFAVFDYLIRAQKESFHFHGRTRRPPLDNVNALLSFLYSVLAHDVTAALEAVGLDPAVGFLHADRPGRKGLALDLMEELRPVLADRLALTLINRGQVKTRGFHVSAAGGVLMDDQTRRTVLQAYQERKREELTHPYLREKIQLGLIAYAQAMLLARHLRGDLDGYPPFAWR